MSEPIPRERILEFHPLLDRMERAGHVFRRQGKEMVTCCPFHEDSKPSFSIRDDGMWFCHPCGFGGSVIDYVMKERGISSGEAFKILTEEMGVGYIPLPAPTKRAVEPARPQETARPKHSKSYDYIDEQGNLLYQVCRFEPKTFRQRHKGPDGNWIWNITDVRLVPYNLPAVLKADTVWITEGEKDADNLIQLGFVATTNAGGSKKWRPEFSELLKGKKVCILPDNDKAGGEHRDALVESLKMVVKNYRVIEMPAGVKDVSDYIETFSSPQYAQEQIIAMAFRAQVLFKGMDIPVMTMKDMEAEYMDYIRMSAQCRFYMQEWLPGLKAIRPLVPGELVSVLAGTGVGKTMILQNIAIACPVPVLLFELELPTSLSFERFAAMATDTSGLHVEQMYDVHNPVKWEQTKKLDHIHCVHESGLRPSRIKEIIEMAELKTGIRPRVVCVDYIQIMGGEGDSRYEKASDAAEQMKIIAKQTGTIIIMASQVGRPKEKKGKEDKREVCLTDAKDSGSIENSSGLVLGAWRDDADKDRMWLRVLKSTKGGAGLTLPCRIKKSLRIHEEATDEQPTI